MLAGSFKGEQCRSLRPSSVVAAGRVCLLALTKLPVLHSGALAPSKLRCELPCPNQTDHQITAQTQLLG